MTTSDNLNQTVWKGDRRDILLMLVILIVIFIVFSFLFNYDDDFEIVWDEENPEKQFYDVNMYLNMFLSLFASMVQSFTHPFFVVLITFPILIRYGFPLFIFRRHVPKKLIIDHNGKSIYIERWKKKEKTLRLDLSYTTYSFYYEKWYCVLEINGLFHNSKGFLFEKNVYKIVAPRLGLAWDQPRMQEIVHVLRKEGVQEVDADKKSFWELINT